MWTHFHDMHSGGRQKLQWAHIFVEADENEAKEFFEEAFNRDPEHTTCNCCGSDYSISTEDSLEQITGFELRPDILIVRRTKEIGNAYPLKQLTEGVRG